MKHVVSVSSGEGSAFVWKLVCDEFGADNVIGVFADVNGEHPDNYRFLAETQYALGSRLVKLGNNGRTIWDVMEAERFIANTRVDMCSRVLKREALLDWLKENCDPADTIVYLGIDWTEAHRFERAKKRWAKDGWTVAAPLCEEPYKLKSDVHAWLAEQDIARPALYALGFSHANCGGGCVKAGIGQFKLLLDKLPKWYAHWERQEERLRTLIGKDVSILRDRSIPSILSRLGMTKADVEKRPTGKDGKPEWWVKATNEKLPTTLPLPLKMLRDKVQGSGRCLLDLSEQGGCGCFTDFDDDDREAA